MRIVGFVFLAVTFGALAFNLKTAYETEAGGLGQVPVFGASVIQVPLLALLGIHFLEEASLFHLLWWHYLLIWLALTSGSGVMIIWMGKLGKSRHG